MAFKHGRLGELWLDDGDMSTYLNMAELTAKVETAEVSTFKSTWKSHIVGQMGGTLAASGYYDPTEREVVDLLQINDAVTTYLPAGGVAIGDQARLFLAEETDYKEGSKVGGAVTFDWTAISDQAIGFGTCLQPMAAQASGNGTGASWDGVMLAAQTTTGAVIQVHVTAMTGGDSLVFTLWDATSNAGAGALAVASGAITVTAVGGYRLVIPGTIRAYCQVRWTGFTHGATFGYVAART